MQVTHRPSSQSLRCACWVNAETSGNLVVCESFLSQGVLGSCQPRAVWDKGQQAPGEGVKEGAREVPVAPRGPSSPGLGHLDADAGLPCGEAEPSASGRGWGGTVVHGKHHQSP